MSASLLTLDEAAARMRLKPKKARDELAELHERHGRLLFRAEPPRARKDGKAPNTKVWVDAERLLELRPDIARRAADVPDRVEELERQVARMQRFQAKAAAWFRRRNV